MDSWLKSLVQRFKTHYPDVSRVIAERFSIKMFVGLPLTILIVVFIINLLLIFDFVEDLINSKSFVVADARVSKFFLDIRSEHVAKAFYLLTLTGNNISVTILTIIGTLLFWAKKKYHYIVALLVTVSGSAISIYSGKNTFHILRPAQNAYYLVKSFSFPSGHATYAMGLYGLLLYMLIRHVSTTKKRILLIVLGVLFILLLGVSRLYLGVHFLSDVLGGFMLGLLWLLTGIYVLEWRKYRLNTHTRK